MLPGITALKERGPLTILTVYSLVLILGLVGHNIIQKILYGGTVYSLFIYKKMNYILELYFIEHVPVLLSGTQKNSDTKCVYNR